MFFFTIKMMFLVNLSFYYTFRFKNPIKKAKSCKPQPNAFLLMQLCKILKYHGLKKFAFFTIKMILAALVQHKTKICPAD